MSPFSGLIATHETIRRQNPEQQQQHRRSHCRKDFSLHTFKTFLLFLVLYVLGIASSYISKHDMHSYVVRCQGNYQGQVPCTWRAHKLPNNPLLKLQILYYQGKQVINQWPVEIWRVAITVGSLTLFEIIVRKFDELHKTAVGRNSEMRCGNCGMEDITATNRESRHL